VARAVEFEGVSKRYARGDARYASLRAAIMELRRGRSRTRGKLALEDISFAVEEGESVALIGPNGAGKTTALKLLARISRPTAGRIRMRGRLAALIEVSSGLHPELTGRENIWLYGRILGMSRSEIRERFDAIVEFAELADVLDRPVKMFSSGMELRLGFAIASHLDPDIFIVDEALAVGDAGFQVKCVERMSALVREGRTLLFVSHNLQAVEALCSRAIFLLDGKMVVDAPSREAVARYLAWTDEHRHRMLERASGGGNGALRVVSATLHDHSGAERYEYDPGEGLELRLRFAGPPMTRPHVNVGISDVMAGLLVQCSMLHDGQAPESVGTAWECRCRIERLPLRPRLYEVFCDVYGEQGHGVLTDWAQVASFRVRGGEQEGPLAVSDVRTSGPVAVDYAWQVTDAS
jgi:ABC-type polysaccharide/polyol phosphate transport system ATPase subunit